MTETGPQLRTAEADADLDTEIGSASDAQLVGRIGRGSHEALAEVYSRHGIDVHNLARQRHWGNAEDVVQDVFLQLWAYPERFDPERGSLGSFLIMQAHGRSIDVLRSESSRRNRETAKVAEPAPAAPAVDDRALARLAGEHARQLLARLPDAERQAITLAYFGGRSYREVATLLAQPEGTIKSRIRSGLRQLRTDLRDGTSPTDRPS